jgi:hypothetical protein
LIPLQHIDLLSLQPHLKHTRDAQGIAVVFDPVRRKNVRATPEEIVRQLWIIYFLETMRLNPKLIAIERAFVINGMQRRFDLVIFDKTTLPVLLAEFKAPGILINQLVFDQIAQYNMELHVPLALVSNGSSHYCFRIDDERRGFEFLSEIPIYPLAP